MSGAAGTKALWYLTRGTGLVSLLLLTLSVVLGILEARRWSSPAWPRFLTAGLHKNVSLLVTAFLTVHIVSAVVDGFAPIGWLDVIVPFRSPYRPVWLGLGAVAVDLLLALVITSLLRQRLGYRAWRAVHWAAYACWPVALLHGLGTGTDVKVRWALMLSLACLGGVFVAVSWRLAGARATSDRQRAIGAAGIVATAMALVAFLVVGPLHAGWSRRAGTPPSLLAAAVSSSSAAPAPSASASGPSAAAAPATTVAPRQPSSVLTAPFSASLQGTLSQTAADASGNTTVRVDGTLTPGGARLSLVLQGPATSDGGVQMQRSSAALGPASQPALYQGLITQLAGTRLVAVVHTSGGATLSLSIQLQIDQSNGVTGTVEGQRASSGDGQ
jgi:sulfoxide reductase heme-binding subunit YedZ